LNIKGSIRFFFKDLIRASALLWKADKAIASVNVVIQFVQALLPILSLYFMKQMIEAVVHASKPFADVVPLIAAYGLIQLLLAVVGQYASYISTIHQHKLTDSLSAKVLEKAIEVDYEYYENPTYHDTLHLAQQQAIYKASQLLSNFNGMLLNSLSLVFLVGFFFTLHSVFALLFIVLSIPLAAIKWYSGFALLKLEKKFAPMEREANYLHQTLTGITSAKEVRVFGFGDYFIKKFKHIRHIVQKEKIKLNARLTWYSLFAEVGEIIAMTFIFGLLAKYTWQKVITVGAFVIYIQGFQRLQSTSKGFLQALVQIFQQRLFLKDLFAFLDLKTNTNVTGDKPFPQVAKGITVNQLSFTYPGTNKQVLNNVSLAINPGSIVAIVGENGSGKSTLVKLLARLYEVQTGDIKVDDDLLSDIDMPSFRENTVFLFQDFEKYFLTVEENITLGDFRDDKIQTEVEAAATLSGAHSFIKNLSNGYKTRMGRMFRGSEQLSGGQWQKLALSRAFYRKARLVILDEPTSALDASAESEVFVNVKEQMKDQMVILITHRLYNLKMADYIYVLKNGNIDQEGKFEDLIAAEGQFKKLYETQKL
jgi:ATP-binding cassette subfamily B protein